jgi:hypothetical protein
LGEEDAGWKPALPINSIRGEKCGLEFDIFSINEQKMKRK